MAGIVNEAADLAASIRKSLEWAGDADGYPNYADLGIRLPAGHWRALLPMLDELAGTMAAENAKGENDGHEDNPSR